MTVEQAALIGAWVAITLLAFAMSGLARQLMVTRRTQTTPYRSQVSVGVAAPMIRGLPLNDGLTRLLFFAEDTCRTCQELHPAIEELSRRFPSLEFVVLYATAVSPHDPSIEALPNRTDAFVAYGVTVTPFVVVVDGDGLVQAAEPIASALALQLMVSSATSINERSPIS